MSPWEVIEDALVHKKPRRNLQWLADQLDVSIQVVSNWKVRGVPAKRYRDLATALGLTLDQLEGIDALPWARASEMAESPFSEDVRVVAGDIDQLPPKQREWVLMVTRQTIDLARETVPANGNGLQKKPQAETARQPKRMSRR